MMVGRYSVYSRNTVAWTVSRSKLQHKRLMWGACVVICLPARDTASLFLATPSQFPLINVIILILHDNKIIKILERSQGYSWLWSYSLLCVCHRLNQWYYWFSLWETMYRCSSPHLHNFAVIDVIILILHDNKIIKILERSQGYSWLWNYSLVCVSHRISSVILLI